MSKEVENVFNRIVQGAEKRAKDELMEKVYGTIETSERIGKHNSGYTTMTKEIDIQKYIEGKQFPPTITKLLEDNSKEFRGKPKSVQRVIIGHLEHHKYDLTNARRVLRRDLVTLAETDDGRVVVDQKPSNQEKKVIQSESLGIDGTDLAIKLTRVLAGQKKNQYDGYNEALISKGRDWRLREMKRMSVQQLNMLYNSLTFLQKLSNEILPVLDKESETREQTDKLSGC